VSGGPAAVRTVVLRPSDFNFLWQECRRCFWLQVVHDQRRPSAPFPRVFRVIADAEAAAFDGQRTEHMVPALAPGVFRHGEQEVLSAPIPVPGAGLAVVIKGRLDMTARFDDGSWGILDFKTALPREVDPLRYGRQLHAYAWAVERPAAGAFAIAPVTTLGLLGVEPREMRRGNHTTELYLRCHPEWVPVARDDDAFAAFLLEVARLLESPEPPPAGARCGHCAYRALARRTAW
jgi:hypothetical protein